MYAIDSGVFREVQAAQLAGRPSSIPQPFHMFESGHRPVSGELQGAHSFAPPTPAGPAPPARRARALRTR